jgi:hypothetical protein
LHLIRIHASYFFIYRNTKNITCKTNKIPTLDNEEHLFPGPTVVETTGLVVVVDVVELLLSTNDSCDFSTTLDFKTV